MGVTRSPWLGQGAVTRFEDGGGLSYLRPCGTSRGWSAHKGVSGRDESGGPRSRHERLTADGAARSHYLADQPQSIIIIYSLHSFSPARSARPWGPIDRSAQVLQLDLNEVQVGSRRRVHVGEAPPLASRRPPPAAWCVCEHQSTCAAPGPCRPPRVCDAGDCWGVWKRA